MQWRHGREKETIRIVVKHIARKIMILWNLLLSTIVFYDKYSVENIINLRHSTLDGCVAIPHDENIKRQTKRQKYWVIKIYIKTFLVKFCRFLYRTSWGDVKSEVDCRRTLTCCNIGFNEQKIETSERRNKHKKLWKLFFLSLQDFLSFNVFRVWEAGNLLVTSCFVIWK